MTLICPGRRAPCPNGAECPHASGWYHCSVHLPVDWSKVRVLDAGQAYPAPARPRPGFWIGCVSGAAMSTAMIWLGVIIAGACDVPR